MSEQEEKYIDMWIGARLGLRSGVVGGIAAGLVLGLLGAFITLFTDFQFTAIDVFNIFWVSGIYGFILGVLGGALAGLIAGAIAGATRVPRNLPLAGAIAGALLAILLMIFFFAVYAWLNTGTTPLGIFLDLAPVGLVAALGGVIGGAVAGRRFKRHYDLQPSASDFESRWEE